MVRASALPHPGSRAPETAQRDPGMGRPGEKSDPSGSMHARQAGSALIGGVPPALLP